MTKKQRILRRVEIASLRFEAARQAYFESTKQSDNFDVWEAYRNHLKAADVLLVGWARRLGRTCLEEGAP